MSCIAREWLEVRLEAEEEEQSQYSAPTHDGPHPGQTVNYYIIAQDE